MNDDPHPADPNAARKLVQDVLADRLIVGRHKAELVFLLLHPDIPSPEIMHLGADGSTRGACGTETDEVGSEHNDITCPFCYVIHEATCASDDGESSYYGWDIDAIMADDSFVDNCLRSLAHRIAYESGSNAAPA